MKLRDTPSPIFLAVRTNPGGHLQPASGTFHGRGMRPGPVIARLLNPGVLLLILIASPAQGETPGNNVLPAGAHYDPAQVNIATSGNRMTVT
ncbi:MAG: hypothetical protein FGM62_05920, partial [Methylobacterium sp.]|nr:hypothetical protein [Methylobacterium sp.]